MTEKSTRRRKCPTLKKKNPIYVPIFFSQHPEVHLHSSAQTSRTRNHALLHSDPICCLCLFSQTFSQTKKEENVRKYSMKHTDKQPWLCTRLNPLWAACLLSPWLHKSTTYMTGGGWSEHLPSGIDVNIVICHSNIQRIPFQLSEPGQVCVWGSCVCVWSWMPCEGCRPVSQMD